MKDHLKAILEAGLAAADPTAAVLRSLRVEDGCIVAGESSFEPDRMFVLAVGKAACAMARAAEELFGERISDGLVVTKDGHEAPLKRLETLIASHPEPDERGVKAAQRVAEFVAPLGEGDVLLTLISGGASALLADPAPPIELEELKRLTTALLRSGASIDEINAVRKRVSTLKGGGLARLASPARTLALLLSDVVGDDPSSIASGLTAPDPTTLGDVCRIVEHYSLELPISVEKHLESAPETPKADDALFEGVTNMVISGGRPTAKAAARKARELGYTPLVLSTRITGEARCVAGVKAAIVREILEAGEPLSPPCALVSGGETTVIVRGDGIGGPNQEFALTLSVELEGIEGWAALAVDTDGGDGPTAAAGALVDGKTARAIRKSGLEPAEALRNNDAYAALKAADALLVTGPSGTNVNDIRVILISDLEER
jgi:glycerate 2-kinase